MKLLQLGTMLVLAATTAASMYLYEKSQPVDAYFTYYGNIPSKISYRWPEEITSYTFGKAPVQPLAIGFVNKLWCTPMGMNLKPILIATRVKEYEEWRFANAVPPIVAKAIDTYDEISTIGVYDAAEIRSKPYLSWSMDDIKPSFNAECYIVVNATVRTKIFGLPKTTRFRASGFDYYVK